MTVTDPSGPARTVSGVPPDGSTRYRTIPQVLSDAARRDPDGTWLRTDDGSLTFVGAAAQVAGTAQALREAGVGHGDLVLVTPRTTGPYLLCWLASPAGPARGRSSPTPGSPRWSARRTSRTWRRWASWTPTSSPRVGRGGGVGASRARAVQRAPM